MFILNLFFMFNVAHGIFYNFWWLWEKALTLKMRAFSFLGDTSQILKITTRRKTTTNKDDVVPLCCIKQATRKHSPPTISYQQGLLCHITSRMVSFRKRAVCALLLLPLTAQGFSSISTRAAATTFRTTTTLKFIPEPSTDQLSSSSQNDVKTDSVVVGAGPAGLLTAIMLAKKFPDQKVKVFDRLDPPPSPTDEGIWSDVAKFYLIGLGSRGQSALRHYGVWDEVEAVATAVVGRKDWSPESDSEDGVERIFTDRPCSTQVLPRDKLVGVMHQHILNNYNDRIELNYGYEIQPEDFEADGNTAVRLTVSKCDSTERNNPAATATSEGVDEASDICDMDDIFSVTANLVIAADGTARTVANEMEKNDQARWDALNSVQKLFAEKPFKVRRYVDDNCRVYKTVPMKIPADWRPDLNYSVRTKDGRINYDALPADREGNYCGVLLVKEGDEFGAPNTDPVKFRAFLDDALPQFSALLDDETVAAIAKKPVSYLPSFRYAGPRLNQGDRTLILGDSAHTVKPYFGLGANSALEDVTILEDAIDATDSIPEAVHLFSDKRAKESESLVKLSRELDRPGKLGFLTFILPLIMDSIFHGMLPKVFAPNTISLLQKEGITFTGVRRRKRFDRLGQVALIGSGITAVSMGVKLLVKSVAKATGKHSGTIAAGMASFVVFATLFKKLSFFMKGNISPADVLTKTNDLK